MKKFLLLLLVLVYTTIMAAQVSKVAGDEATEKAKKRTELPASDTTAIKKGLAADQVIEDIQARTQSTKDNQALPTTKPTEEAVLPTEETVLPTEETVLPTEETVLPTEELTQARDTIRSKEKLQAERDLKAAKLGEVQAQIEALSAEQTTLAADILLLDDEILPWPRWSNNFSGTLGFNLVNTENWFLRGEPSISSTTINAASTGFVLLEHLKWYWKTDYRASLGWLKFDNKDLTEDINEFRTTNDVFQAKSIFGWRIQEKLFFSSGLYYRTSLLDNKFNDPGYLTFAAAGLTWKPVPNLVIDIAPLTYNYVITNEDDLYQSSFGNNLQITYSYPITKSLIWKTDLTAFTSYQDTQALSNWTWFNMLTTSVKGLGLVFDIGFRSNRQEALAFGAAEDARQMWWMLGINYAFSVAKK